MVHITHLEFPTGDIDYWLIFQLQELSSPLDNKLDNV